jgi:putative membrane protein
MKYPLLFAASIAVMTLAGCKKDADPATDATATIAPSEDPAMAADADSPGQAFANVAAASDAFEIETSKLAIAKGSSAKIKTFADQMIKAHTDSTAKLKTASAAATPAITPVATLSAAQQSKLDGLGAKSGADFDRAYAEIQVAAHQETLDALKGYSAGGEVASLNAFAKELVPIVTAHLNMAKSL